MHLRSIFTVVAVAALTGCGLKGPLYLPGEKGQSEAAGETRSDKDRRPRPAPQVQKEEGATPTTESDAPVTPVDPDRPDTTPSSGTR